MARRKHLITYPDGSKKYVDSFDREQMLLAGEIRKDGDHYCFVGATRSAFKRFHSLQELSSLGLRTESAAPLRRFYPGHFKFRLGEKTQNELMESPENLAVRLPSLIDALARSAARTEVVEERT